MEKIFTSNRVRMTCVDPWSWNASVRCPSSANYANEWRIQSWSKIVPRCQADSSYYGSKLQIYSLSLSGTGSRHFSVDYARRYFCIRSWTDAWYPLLKFMSLDERFSSLCDMLFCLSEDNILEDLLSVGGRVRYAELLNASSVRSDYVAHDSRGEERSACVFYTIKCIVFFLVLFWEVSATLCRKSSVKLTLQKTIILNMFDWVPKLLDRWSSSQIIRKTSFWRSIAVIRSLILQIIAHTLSDNPIMIE